MGSQESRPAADTVAGLRDAVAPLARDPSTFAKAQQVVADIERQINDRTLEFSPEMPPGWTSSRRRSPRRENSCG